jgi:hypothetical protein
MSNDMLILRRDDLEALAPSWPASAGRITTPAAL